MFTRTVLAMSLGVLAAAAAAFAAAGVPAGPAATAPAAPAAPAAPGKNVTIKRQVLAEHQTVAKFQSIAYRRCNGLTALCPNNCGDSGDFATFQIVGYVAYNKLGEYGDPKATLYSFQVNDNHAVLKITKEYADAVKGLKNGDYVLLNWNHEYVTREEDNTSAAGPERPLTKVQVISKEEADKLLAGAATQAK